MYIYVYKRVEGHTRVKEGICIFTTLWLLCSSPRFIGKTRMPTPNKNWPEPIWCVCVCAGCAQPMVFFFFFRGETQEKRDKGYVLEQLSAAKTVPFFPSSSCLQFLYSILLFLFWGYIYPAQYTRKKKVSFPNNRREIV